MEAAYKTSSLRLKVQTRELSMGCMIATGFLLL